MDKENFNKLFTKKEAEIIEYYYTVSHGTKELHSYSKKIKHVDDEHFTTSGYGYHIKYDDMQKWRMQSMSSNSYSYSIFLLKDDCIYDYVFEINNSILKSLNKEISELQKTIEVINNSMLT